MKQPREYYKIFIRERIGEFETLHETIVYGSQEQAQKYAEARLVDYYGNGTCEFYGDGEYWDPSLMRCVSLYGSIVPVNHIQVLDLDSECNVLVPLGEIETDDVLPSAELVDLSRLPIGWG